MPGCIPRFLAAQPLPQKRNDTICWLDASVFTDDVNRARQVGARLHSGTVVHNGMRADLGLSFGGYKQSGIRREGIRQRLQYFLETKFMILDGHPEGYESTPLGLKHANRPACGCAGAGAGGRKGTRCSRARFA